MTDQDIKECDRLAAECTELKRKCEEKVQTRVRSREAARKACDLRLKAWEHAYNLWLALDNERKQIFDTTEETDELNVRRTAFMEIAKRLRKDASITSPQEIGLLLGDISDVLVRLRAQLTDQCALQDAKHATDELTEREWCEAEDKKCATKVSKCRGAERVPARSTGNGEGKGEAVATTTSTAHIPTLDPAECKERERKYLKTGAPRKIGKGAYGQVWKVCVEGSCGYVLKVSVLKDSFAEQTAERDVYYLRELQKHAIEGKAIVPRLYDAWRCAATTNKPAKMYILMELFDTDMAKRAKRRGKEMKVNTPVYDAHEIRRMFLIASLVGAENVANLDIKPNQFLYSATNNNIVLTDFGFAGPPVALSGRTPRPSALLGWPVSLERKFGETGCSTNIVEVGCETPYVKSEPKDVPCAVYLNIIVLEMYFVARGPTIVIGTDASKTLHTFLGINGLSRNIPSNPCKKYTDDYVKQTFAKNNAVANRPAFWLDLATLYPFTSKSKTATDSSSSDRSPYNGKRPLGKKTKGGRKPATRR